MAKTARAASPPAAPTDARDRIVDALLALAAEMPFEEIAISDVAARAGVTLADFRDHFPSKGAVLGALSRRIDRAVLVATDDSLIGEPAKDRLFDVLMRRLDAMKPHRSGLQGVMEWARRDPVAALALNQMAVNSMRFMMEAAHLRSDGASGAIKLQGLVLLWTRVLDVWFRDEDPGMAATMARLDRELDRGGKMAGRIDDLHRLSQPLRTFARALCETRSRMRRRAAPRRDERGDEVLAV